jgi:hypothetical protein
LAVIRTKLFRSFPQGSGSLWAQVNVGLNQTGYCI